MTSAADGTRTKPPTALERWQETNRKRRAINPKFSLLDYYTSKWMGLNDGGTVADIQTADSPGMGLICAALLPVVLPLRLAVWVILLPGKALKGLCYGKDNH